MSKTGRPTDYSTEMANTICERLCDGESLNAICRDKAMPARSSVFLWLSKHQEFSDQYARAREVQADALFDDIMEIADNGTNDWMERNGKEDAGWQVNGEHLQRSRLRVDARKWAASKLKPKKYGEKIAVGGDSDMDPIQVTGTSTADLRKEAEMLAIELGLTSAGNKQDA